MKIKLKSDFVKNVFTLMTGTVIAQIIPIASTPLLTRIYSPQDFGVFGIYLSITTIFGTICTLSYPFAILVSNKDDDAIDIVHLCVISTLIFSVIFGFLLLFFKSNIATIFKTPEINTIYYLFPISTINIGLGTTFSLWANRNKFYKIVSISRASAALTGAILNILLGLITSSAFGLIISSVINQFILSSILITYSICKNTQLLNFLNSKNILKQAIIHKKYAIFTFPGEMLNVILNQLPIYFLNIFASKTEVGYFNMSNRILGLPIIYIGRSISEVFQQKASEFYSRFGNCSTLFLKTAKFLTLISIIPFSILLLFGPQLFSLILGFEWAEAGVYARYLSLLYLLRFIVRPFSYLFYITGRQLEDLLIVIFLFLSTYILLTVFLPTSIHLSIISYSLNYSAVYIYIFVRTYILSKEHSK